MKKPILTVRSLSRCPLKTFFKTLFEGGRLGSFKVIDVGTPGKLVSNKFVQLFAH